MGLNIKLNNNFSITSTSFAFCLNKTKVKGEDSEKAGEEYLEKLGEYTTLEQVFNGYMYHSVRDSDIETIDELKSYLKDIKNEIKSNYTIKLEEL